MSDFDPKDIQEDLGNDFAKEDIASSAEPVAMPIEPSISAGESALKGAQQGLTMGLSDEASGAIQASLDALNRAGNKLGLLPESPTQVSERLEAEGITGAGPKSVLDLYRQARDEERARIAAAGEANPGSFTAGGVAGGLLGLKAIPGLGAATELKAATGAGKIAESAALGVGMGAATGLGVSEADLTKGEIKDALVDTSEGALLGGLIGGGAQAGLGAAGAALSGTKRGAEGLINKTASSDILDVFKKAAKGESLSGKSPELVKNIQDKGMDLLKVVRGQAEKLEQQKQQLLKVEGADKKVDLTKLLSDYSEKIKSIKTPDPDVQKVQQGMLNLIEETSSTQPLNNLAVDDAYKIKQLLQSVSGGLKSPELQKITNATSREVQNAVDAVVPGLKEINKQQSNLMTQTKSLLGVNPLEALPNEKLPAFLKKTGTTLEKLGDESSLQLQASKNAALEGFENIKGEKIPGIKELVPQASAVVDEAKKVAKDIQLSKKLNKDIDDNIITDLTNPYKIADIAGKVVKPFVNMGQRLSSELPDLMASTSRQLREATPDNLKLMADDITTKMGDSAAVEANILRKASERSGVSRDALIFSLMQRPGFREYINKEKPFQEEE